MTPRLSPAPTQPPATGGFWQGQQLLLCVPTPQMTAAVTKTQKEPTSHGSAVLPREASLPNGLTVVFSLLRLPSHARFPKAPLQRARKEMPLLADARTDAKETQGHSGCWPHQHPTSDAVSLSCPKTIPTTHFPPATHPALPRSLSASPRVEKHHTLSRHRERLWLPVSHGTNSVPVRAFGNTPFVVFYFDDICKNIWWGLFSSPQPLLLFKRRCHTLNSNFYLFYSPRKRLTPYRARKEKEKGGWTGSL